MNSVSDALLKVFDISNYFKYVILIRIEENQELFSLGPVS